MTSPDILGVVGQYGFPIAVSVYLLWERTSTFKQIREEMAQDRARVEVLVATTLEIVKANTASNTELRVTIQKLCEIVNGGNKNGA